MFTNEECFPLSLSQLNILNLERSLAGTSVNNISTTIRINGRLDFTALQQSINRVIESDSSLRTRLVTKNGEMMQYHAPFVKEEFPVYDFSNTSSEGIENWENSVTRELINLEGGALYRFVLFRDSENSGGVLVKLHHIIADGWSQIMLCNKIGETYLELLSGKEPLLDAAPEYSLHIQEEQDYLSSKAFARDEKYWKQVLSGMGEPCSLKAVNGASVSPVGRRLSFELPQIINHAIFSFCEEKRVAPFAVFYMALAIYFKRNGGTDDFTIGVPIFNRTSYEFKRSSGMFVTTLPFRNEINDEWNLNDFNEILMDKWYELLRHQRFPFSKIYELSGNNGRLFNIALSYQDSKIYESTDASVHFSGRWHYCGYQAEQLTIHLTNLKNHQQYAVDYDYLAQYFTENEIVALHNSICHILNEALSHPECPIHSLNVIPLEEKEKVLYTFNKTEKHLEEKSVYEVLLKKCRKHLNRIAIIHNGERMSYGTLLHRAAQFASALGEKNIKSNDLVAIMLPREFDLLASMVGTLQQGCAYLLLSDSMPPARIKQVILQSGAAAIVGDEKKRNLLSGLGIPFITTDDVDESYGIFAPVCGESKMRESDMLAYVVYTSGSTGEPKGVEITQRNLLNLAQEMESIYAQGAVLSVCNVGFDAFMLESIVALLNGRTIVLPTDSDLESPERLAELMNGYAVGFFAMTPSRLSALLSNKAFKKVMWRMESIVCGGEAFPAELLRKLKLCTNARIYNQYGPSETTVAVSMKELSRADKITAGSPMGNCKLYVLDQWMNPLPVGGRGKLFVGGKCVGNGYRKNSELTEKVFLRNPFVSNDKIYDTGDVACWTPDGEIVLLGRSDNQVKLRGFRIELQEVAACIESYPGITLAYAKICNINGNDALCAYYVSDYAINEFELISYAATYLPEYMIPSVLMRVDRLPITANGKIDDSALPTPDCKEDETVATTSRTAEIVLEIFKKILNAPNIHAGSDYFRNGGNSLNSMQCIMEIEEKCSKRIRVADLYAHRTAAKLAAFIDGGHASGYVVSGETASKENVLIKSEIKNEYPLTAIQQGIYVQSVLDKNGCSYNMPGAFKLEHALDEHALESAFVSLINDDPIFRTVFVQGKNGIVARILENVSFKLEHINAKNFEAAQAEFLRPFDLSEAPLLRAAVWVSECDEMYLFVDSHHIIGDGLSTPVILQRLDEAYRNGKTKTEWNFYDYLNTVARGPVKKEKMMDYWKTHLLPIPEKLDFCGDFSGPKHFDYKGKEYSVLLDEEISRACEAYCKSSGISEFVVFLAAYGLLLSSVSGKNDMVVGVPVSTRLINGLEKVCGPFINTLPLRLKVNKEKTIKKWLSELQNDVMSMLDNVSVTLEDIITELGLPRGEQNALYQVMMTQSPVNSSEFKLADSKMEYNPISTGSVKMDLIMELSKVNEGYALNFSYATCLFEKDTIEFFGRCIATMVEEFLKDESRTLSSVKLISSQDVKRLIDEPNYSVTPFLNIPVHKKLQKVISTAKDKTAVIWHGEKFTYEKIEKRASRIADFIESKGVGAGKCVALCMKRTPDMIAAMYGVLKAGCAYMFILDSFPEERIRYMLEISDAALLLCDDKVIIPEGIERTGMVFAIPDGESVDERNVSINESSITNVLFTSGSTGRPKGVMLRHRSVSNLFSQMEKTLGGIDGNVLCSTNSVFDCFIVETLIALSLGKTVVLADDEEMMLPWRLAELIEEHNAGIIEMTPSRLNMCLGNERFQKLAKHIKIVLLGGEVVSDTLLNKFSEHSDGILMNMYGPTEATVFTTMEPLEKGKHITIGRPLQNTRTYVLDENMNPVIPTACGELYIAGECLSSGYIGREDLTNELFVDDIYFAGEKMYRSGDLVRLRVDGRYDYIGRKDLQVKLNGQRVELNEITAAIESVSAGIQASTVAVKKKNGTMELCSFYVCNNEDVTNSVIQDGIKKILPNYMIPSAMVRLDKMPMTATNKVDNVVLRAMAEEGFANVVEKNTISEKKDETVKTEKIPVEISPSIEYVLSVWNSVLSTPVNSGDASFFDNGGTSMGALTVLSAYYNDKFEISLNEFYENPTAYQQAELLKKGRRVSAPAHFEKKSLVSGATGFFGAHLLKELVDTEAKRVMCITRDGDKTRMEQVLTNYFGYDEAQKILEKTEIFKGDIAKSNFGMSDDEYSLLVESVDEIYHCAADVRHYAVDIDAYINTNVGGTQNMIALAKKAKAKLYHMSTCSVSGDSMKNTSNNAVFTEDDFDIGQEWEKNIYIKSKYLAEKAIFAAIADGVDAKIFRLGRLVGRESDGKFQSSPDTNAFYLVLKGFCQIGAIPVEIAKAPIDLMPIDRSAKEVLLLKRCDAVTYHIMNPLPPTIGEVFTSISKSNRIVDMNEFYNVLKEQSSKLERSLWALVMNNINSNAMNPAIQVTNTKTTQALESLGIKAEGVDVDMVLKEFWKGE